MRALTKKFLTAITAGSLAFTTAACSNDESSITELSTTSASSSASSEENIGESPRTITHELGETVIEAKPERIASTGISVTGTLPAIDAPLIASAATNPSEITDAQGFFSQWSDEAEATGVEVLYPGLQFNMELLIAQDSDLVIVSIAGADSVADEYEQISA